MADLFHRVSIRTVSYTHLDVYKRQCIHTGVPYGKKPERTLDRTG